MTTAGVLASTCKSFWSDLGAAQRRALLLDYDGTIAPFTADRQRAFPYPTVPELLDCIVRTCCTRVVLVSGRAAQDLPPLLGLNPPPEIWGAHGLERLHPDGQHVAGYISEASVRALAAAAASLEGEGLEQVCEIKPGAIAVHWRGLGRRQAEEVRTKAYRALSTFVCRSEVFLSEFDGGIEVRVRQPNKGDAVQAIIAECEKDTPIAYLGDDVSDEDAFRALNGRGLTVLVRPMYRFTAARLWLRPPGDVIQFLADWVRACEGDL